jgi:CspA family cold shock protein
MSWRSANFAAPSVLPQNFQGSQMAIDLRPAPSPSDSVHNSTINGLFVPQKELKATVAAATSAVARAAAPLSGNTALTAGEAYEGSIQHLKAGFGFVLPKSGGANMFFFHSAVTNADFNELKVGDKVRYCHGKNDKGPCAVDIELLR